MCMQASSAKGHPDESDAKQTQTQKQKPSQYEVDE